MSAMHAHIEPHKCNREYIARLDSFVVDATLMATNKQGSEDEPALLELGKR